MLKYSQRLEDSSEGSMKAQACTLTAQPQWMQPVQNKRWITAPVSQGSTSLLCLLPPQTIPSVSQHDLQTRLQKLRLYFLSFFFLKEEKSGRVPHIKELCYSTNELPLLSPLSPHLQNSVEHYWSGVLVCRLGHMTEDIFFCYNAKEAPEKDKQKRSIKLKGERKQELNL